MTRMSVMMPSVTMVPVMTPSNECRSSRPAPAYNFCSGPGPLPEPVMERLREELHPTDRLSPLTLYHRSPRFTDLADRLEESLRTLLSVPPSATVLFLSGGAVAQFAMTALNLTPPGRQADYLLTGHWSRRAVDEARRVVPDGVNVVSADPGPAPRALPPPSSWSTNEDAAYFFYVDNETVDGLEFAAPPPAPVPLVVDMSSNFLSRPIEPDHFGVIFASAQKNLGLPGLCVVILREDMMERAAQLAARRPLSSLWSYAEQKRQRSLCNTPASFVWYVAGLVLDWMRENGGVAALAEVNRRKADKLYAAIDASDLYNNDCAPADRSRMNAVFFMKQADRTPVFLREAEAAGLNGLAGHRQRGGLRAALYNAVSEEAVETLIDFMRDFERRRV